MARPRTMKYALIPLTTHTELLKLLRIHAEQARKGVMVAYSSVGSGAKAFEFQIKEAPIFTLNKFGLPCDPKGGEAVSFHILLAYDSLKPLCRILTHLDQSGIAEEVNNSPTIDVPDRFRFNNTTDEFSVEHWTQEEAHCTLLNTSWITDKEIHWQGSSGGYAIGSIERVYSYPEPKECELLDLTNLPLTLPILALSEQAIEMIREQVYRANLEINFSIQSLTITERKEIKTTDDDLPF